MNGTVEVKFGDWFQEGFDLYKANFGLLVLVSLVVLVLSGVTLGILAGPMMAGMILVTMALYDRRQPPPQFGDVFQGFQHFAQMFLFFLIWFLIMFVISLILQIIPILGQLASLVLFLVVPALLMFAPYLIVDRKMAFWPASMESIRMVRTNFWPFLGLGIVASILGQIGGIACGVGVIFTLPIQACVLTAAYRNVYRGAAAESMGAAPPPPPQPTASVDPPPTFYQPESDPGDSGDSGDGGDAD